MEDRGVEDRRVDDRGVHDLGVYDLGDMRVLYRADADRQVSFQMWPIHLQPVAARTGIGADPSVTALPGAGDPPARPLDPLVHVALRTDDAPAGFAQGRTMRWAGSTARFGLDDHRITRDGPVTRIQTTLASAEGLRIEHVLTHRQGEAHLSVDVTFVNGSPGPVVIDALTSFGVSGITPFDTADACGRLVVHRLRSAWSAEARPVAETIESLHLERSWLGVSRLSERFGQVGTMPSRGWFPFLAVEDAEAGVVWGAQLAWAGSWQLEVARQGDDISISGGLADREFGHWSHTSLPGERLSVPSAVVSCVAGSVDDLADRLVSAPPARATPTAGEDDLPIVFNEWCTSWGTPDRDRVLAIADRLQGEGIEYLVIDAGWYRDSSRGDSWASSHGDWQPDRLAFPGGLSEVAAAIWERGMTPGLWFEYETVGETSAAYQRGRHLLQRDGVPLTVGARRFWDLTDSDAVTYLTETVIEPLERDGFGYLKIDYNEHLGLGVDHPDGLGEGLRRQVLASYRFLDTLRTRMPNLVVENCASGGHRLEPSMIARTDMSSFSDAHELPEIPLIAANLLRVMPARQMQIWSVLRADLDSRELHSRLAATFIGRMCVSGEVLDLTETQWEILRAAIALYRRAVPVIRSGRSRRGGQIGPSLRHPTGWQSIVRYGADDEAALVVLHTFEAAPQHVEMPLSGSWVVTSAFHDASVEVSVVGESLVARGLREGEGVAVLLHRIPLAP